MKQFFKFVLTFACMSGFFIANNQSISASTNGFELEKEAGEIVVKNDTAYTVEVSINRWGTGGSTSFYDIPANGQEAFDRSDSRDFILALRRNGQVERYIVRTGDNIVISYNQVFRNPYGTTLQPLLNHLTTSDDFEPSDDTITFTNNTDEPINVSINTWGTGSTGWYEVSPGETETWSRDDMRGFVIEIELVRYNYTFFIMTGENITWPLAS